MELLLADLLFEILLKDNLVGFIHNYY